MTQLNLFEEYDQPQKRKTYSHLFLFIDGAARNNPGPAGAGIIIVKDDREIEKQGFYLGNKTNNQAEYFALLLGLFFIQKYYTESDHIQILSDSQLLVKQFHGEYKIKHPELKPLHRAAKKILNSMQYSIAHILREYNKRADQLANEGIDQKRMVPIEFIEFLKKHGLDF